MNIPFSVFRFLAIIAFLGVVSSGIFINTVKAQQLENADTTAQISEIEIASLYKNQVCRKLSISNLFL